MLVNGARVLSRFHHFKSPSKFPGKYPPLRGGQRALALMVDPSVFSAAERMRSYGCLATLTPNYATSIHTAQAFSTHVPNARATHIHTQRHHSVAKLLGG